MLLNSNVREWLGLPKGLRSVELYSNRAQLLLMSSQVWEVRLEMSLTDQWEPKEDPRHSCATAEASACNCYNVSTTAP